MVLDWLLIASVILLPRYYLWGAAPAGIHGDEGGFASVGVQMFAAPQPLWSFGPQSLPNAHFWLFGAAIHALGYDIWSARFVTSLFGIVQAFAIADIARRTAGMAAALTAALVMAIPLQLHFDRLAMCNVMTMATWAVALWCIVRFPWRLEAAAAAGMLLGLGWYGYQSSRIVPLIAAAGLLPLLARADTRRPAIRMAAAGLLGFAIVIAPLAIGFVLHPETFLGRAGSTSWLAQPAHGWPVLVGHLSATAWASVGLRFDESGGFFPFAIPVIPFGLMALALLGLFACRSAALRWCLATWIVLVLAGNFLRYYPVYAPVLVCLVPAVALAAACSARWLRWLAPLAVALAIAQPVRDYFRNAVRIPVGEILPMAQAALLRDMDEVQTVVIAGGVGCGHGMTNFALHGRTCLNPGENVPAGADPPQLFIVFPPFNLESSIATRGDLVEYQRRWNTTTVHIRSSVPLPPERS